MNNRTFFTHSTEPIKYESASEAYKATISGLSARITNIAQSKFKMALIGVEKGIGTTSIVCSLSEVLSTFKKVLLIDANFINPKIAEHYGIVNSIGFSNVLHDNEPIENVINKVNDNLDIITCGTICDVALKDLVSGKLTNSVGEIEDKYDFVLFDTADINENATTVTVASLIKNVLLVVEGRSKRSLTKNAFNSLDSMFVNILGVVLNKKNTDIV